MVLIGFIMFIIVILYSLVIIVLKEYTELLDYLKKIPYIVLVAFFIFLIYAIPPILLIVYGKDELVSSFKNIVGTLLISYLFEKLLMGMFNFTKVYFFKNNLGKPINKLEEQYEYNFERLEQLLRILISFSIVSVYSAVFSYSYLESFFCWLPVPFTRLIIIELIFVGLILLLVIGFHIYLNKTIKNIDD